MSCVRMKKPVRTTHRGADISMAIENDKAIITFQDTPRPRRRPGRENIRWRLGGRVQVRGRLC